MAPSELVLALCLLAFISCGAASPVLQGFDVVEYFNLADRETEFGVLGLSTYACRLLTHDFSGGERRRIGYYEFWFSTIENVELFEKDPWKYAPKYGGFSSWDIANDRSPFSPWSKEHMGPPAHPWDSWTVHEGSLYLTSFPATSDKFFQSARDNIARADRRWIEWYGDLYAGPFNLDCQSSVCFSLAQPQHDLSKIPEDTPDIECSTSGFMTPWSDLVNMKGTTQLEAYKGDDGSPSLLGGSGDSRSHGSPGTGAALDLLEGVPANVDGSLLGGSGQRLDPGQIKPSEPKDEDQREGEEGPFTNPGLPGPQLKILQEETLVRPVMVGYDTVSFFNIKATEEGIVGHPKYACHLATYDKTNRTESLIGVYEFWFANPENMKKFEKNPWKYAPHYGGFCSWGTATELSEDGWPWSKSFQGPPGQPWDGWTVFEDKLYINYWPSIAGSFFADPDTHIKSGNERWIGWYGDLKAGPLNTHCTHAACVYIQQSLSPPCPPDAVCSGDIPEVSCVIRESVTRSTPTGQSPTSKLPRVLPRANEAGNQGQESSSEVSLQNGSKSSSRRPIVTTMMFAFVSLALLVAIG